VLEQELLILVISARYNEVVAAVRKDEHFLVTQMLVFYYARLSIFIAGIKLVNQVLCQNDCIIAIHREPDRNRLPKVLILVSSVNLHFEDVFPLEEDGLWVFLIEQ